MSPESSAPTADADEEISALIETLAVTEQRLAELTGGQVDTVAGRDGRTFLLRRAQEQLRDREAAKQAATLHELRVLFDLVPANIWFKDTKNNFLRVNKRGVETTGMSVAEVEGKSAAEIFPEQAAASYADDLEVIQSGSPKLGMIEKLRGPDGQDLWVQTDKVPVCDVNGKVTGLVVMAQDISARKRSEEALRISKERLRAALSASGTGTFRWDIRTDELNWDESLAALFGLSSEETVCTLETFIARVHPDDRPEVTERCKRCAREGADFSMEFRVLWPDGSVHWLHDKGKTFFDDAGRPIYMTGACVDITEQKRSEARFHRLIDSNVQGVIFWNTKGEITAANDSFLKLVGYTRDDLEAGRISWSAMTPSKFADDDARALKELAATGVCIPFEKEFIRKDGTHVPILVGAAMLEDNPDDGVCFVLDMTEPKRASGLLMESQERLSLATESAHVGIWDWDVVTNSLVWDRQMYALYGIRPEDFSGAYDAWQNGLHPEDRKRCETEIFTAVEGAGGFHTEFRVIWANGEIHDIEAHGIMHRAADGSAARMVGVNWDITARKQAEKKAGEQANLLNLAHDAIMVRDTNDRIEFWNHGAELLYGWTAEEVCGRGSSEFLYSKTQADDLLAAQRTFLADGAWSGECRHLTKDGSTVIVRCRWTLLRDEHGQPKSKLVINTDMTEQKKIEEQFLRNQRLESIGTLASGVAHDLNNILVPIMMAAPVLRGEMDPAERERFLDIVETSAHRGAGIINQVLTFARGADGDRILLQPIYVLEEVSKIARQTFPKSIVVRTAYEEDIRSLEGDATQLHQVLLNLCINARDAMPDGGELRLSVENFDVDEHYARVTPGAVAGPHVMLQVTDNGSGISKEVIAKIYDPFFTTKSIGRGTGLGLSTVAGIVKSHGGFIHVYSHPGQTTFKVFLPAKETVGISGVLRAEAPVPRGQGEIILLVDDEPTIREIAEVILTNHGYKVLLAEDGVSAVAIFARQPGKIDVVVTDLSMPGMGGLMLVQTLRQIEPQLKIVLSTGGADDNQTAEILALNVNGFLTKPYAGRRLLLKLNDVLHRSLHLAA